ncbi:MAG: rhomboid family intramembrane serine protease [Anaerolineae bacterium]|nr:rhomboid family intramembrane serine protease [Anaerolineae bacterium]
MQPPTPEHHSQQPPRQPIPQRIAVPLPVAQPRLTYLLLGIIVVIYAYYFSLSPFKRIEFLTDWAKINEFIKDGEYYRLLSSMFLHLNLMHILFNGYALYVIGRDVEGLFGHVRFAVIYFLGGLSGALASFVFTQAPSVGASGAIFAIFGAEMVYFYQNRHLHGQAGKNHLRQLVILMLFNLGLGLFSSATDFRIDNAGHIGGLVGGAVLAWFIGPEYQVTADPTSTVGLRVVDGNPAQRWALPLVAYAVTLGAMVVYAVTA